MKPLEDLFTCMTGLEGLRKIFSLKNADDFLNMLLSCMEYGDDDGVAVTATSSDAAAAAAAAAAAMAAADVLGL